VYRFAFILLLLACQLAVAQRYLSYPEKESRKGPQDTTRISELNEKAFRLRESNPSLALQYSQDAYHLASVLHDKRGMARALGNSGWIYYRRGDFARALEDSYEGLKLSEITGDEEELARALNNIGAVYFEQRQFISSIVQFKLALETSQNLRDTASMVRSLNNIAYASLHAGLNLDSAMAVNQKALLLSEKINNNYLISFCYRVRGEIYEVRGQHQQALADYQETHRYGLLSNLSSIKVATAHRIGRVLFALNKVDDAQRVLLENVKEAQALGYRDELEKSYKLLAQVYERKNNPRLAYHYLNMHLVLHDSLFNEQNTAKLASLKSKFEADIKQTQIELLTKESALKQEEIMRQRLQLYAVIGGWSFVCIIAVTLLISFQRAKRAKTKLEYQKEELARKNRVIEEKSAELARLNTTKDKLFSIIGHDFRSPLQSLKGMLDLISRGNLTQTEFNLYSRELKNKIDIVYMNLNNLLNWSVMQLQGIQTKPVTLKIKDVADEIVHMYKEASQQKGIFLCNNIPDEVSAFADRDHTHLIIRNLVGNAVKFTSSGTITLSAYCTEDFVAVNVEDSGIGIAKEDVDKLFNNQSLWTSKGTNNEKGLGLGLHLCKEFIEKNYGELSVKSTIGIGTTFTFTLRKATVAKPSVALVMEAQPSA